MWGIASRPRAIRPLALAGLLLLTACASHRPAPQAAVTPPPPAGERDATGAYRFNMTQNGRRMTADEFDAWMKARGIRVAKGAPAKVEPARASAQAKAKAPAKSVRPKTTVASTTPPAPAQATVTKVAGSAKPAAVAQAKPKTKPKPVAKEVSQAKAPVKQASGEG